MRIWEILLAGALMAGSGSVWGFSLEALPTHGVFYAGLAEQPCLRIKVTAQEGEKLRRVVCSAGATAKGTVSAAHLYRSEYPFFALHAEGDAAARHVAKSSAAAGKMVFKLSDGEFKAGDNYFWLVYDIASSAKGGAKVYGELLGATGGEPDKETKPDKGKNGAYCADGVTRAKPAEVYPFKYRIAPYVRPKWACKNNKAMFDAAHLKNMTDFIVFGYTHKGTALAGAHDAVEGDKDYTAECKELAKALRGAGKARILAGFSCNEAKNPMSAVMHDAEKRRALVRHMAALVLEDGYEGIDLDWEYPRENSRFKARATWRKFAVFLGELRAALAGTGASLSVAVTTRYDAPNIEVLEGVDFINSMSYGRPGEHSTKAAAQEDVSYLIKRKIPPVKVVLGLPFFSRDTKPKHADSGGLGYSSILRMHPNLPPARNTFKHAATGELHFFNSPDLIRDKCRTFVLQQGCGGVCIWAYDTDVPMSHPKSLSKALYSVLRQVSR